MRRDRDRGDAELLAAYVDGVAELSLDERKRVDDLLARDPALRADEAAARALLGELRDLPAAGGEPDWTGLERSIREAVGAEVPRRWWQRVRLRVIVIPFVLAAAAVMIALAVPTHDQRSVATTDPPVVDAAPEVAATETAGNDDVELLSVPLWLDGTDLDVALEAAELFELGESDAVELPETAELLPSTDLESIDELDGETLDHVDELLDDHPRRGRS